jgi:hypothetical protein
VVLRRRAGEQVIGEPKLAQVLGDDPAVAVGELAGADPFAVGLDLDRRAVLVRAADHQYLVTDHSLVTAEDVRGNAEAGNVADVPWAIGVGPSDGGQDVFAH